jgi:MFS family permease
VPDSEARRILPLIVAISGMGVLTFSLISPTLPDLADTLGVSRGLIGFVQGAVAVPGIFLALFIGYLADLKGRRFVGVGSLLVFGAAGVAGFFAREFWILVIVRAVQGLGTSGILSLGVIVISDLYPAGSQRRRALGINAAGLTATAIVAPIIGGALADGGVFRPYLVYAFAFPVAWWARRLPGRPDGDPPDPPLRHARGMIRSLRADHKLSDFVGLLPFSLTMMVLFAGFAFTATPLLLERVFDVGSTGRGLLQSLMSVGLSTGSLLAAGLVERVGATVALSIATGLAAAGFLGGGLVPTLWLLAPLLALLGTGIGLTFPIFQDFVGSSVPANYRGAAVGTWVSSIRTGQFVGPIVASAVANGIGEQAAYLAAGVAATVVLISWRPLRRVAADVIGVEPPTGVTGIR